MVPRGRISSAAGVVGRLSHCWIIRFADPLPRFNSGGVRRVRGDTSSGSYTAVRSTGSVDGTGTRRTLDGGIPDVLRLMRKADVDLALGMYTGRGRGLDDEACA